MLSHSGTLLLLLVESSPPPMPLLEEPQVTAVLKSPQMVGLADAEISLVLY